MAKNRSDVGTLYRGSPGQWSWFAHRATGVAVILFLFVHILDTAMVGWGPEVYEKVESVYKNWFVRILELGLVAAVLYHGINGMKIMVYDFWSKGSRYYKRISLVSHAIFLAAMLPITWIMGQQVLNLLDR